MILLIFALIGIGVGIWVAYDIGDGFVGYVGYALLLGLSGLLIGALIMICAMCSLPPIENCNLVEIEKTELIALKDNFGVKGNYYLFSRHVDDELEYTYIVDHPQLGMTTKSVDANVCFIKYIEEDGIPYIQKWEARHPNSIVHWLFMPSQYFYTIYLPGGSVIQNEYEIDLE